MLSTVDAFLHFQPLTTLFQVQISSKQARFCKLLLGSRNTTCSVTRNSGCLWRKNSL